MVEEAAVAGCRCVARRMPIWALSENCNVAISLREMKLRLAERDGYYLAVVSFPTKPSRYDAT